MNDFDPNFIPKKIYYLVGQKAIILNKDGKILVLQRSEKAGAGGKWALPGGALEQNENPIEAIKREIMEETKLEVISVEPSSLRSYLDEGDAILIIGYKCKASSENVTLNWEHDDYKWLSKDDASNLDLTEDAKYFIEQFE